MTPTSPQLGSIDWLEGRTILSYRTSLAHRSAKVWAAVTESEHMRWWMPVDMSGERSEGATVEMTFWADLVTKKGLDPDAGTAEISAWNPPEVFEWVWHEARIRFELEQTHQGCDLHLLVDIGPDDLDHETIIDNAAGYHLWIEHLSALLNNGSSPPIADGDPQRLAVQYRSLMKTLLQHWPGKQHE